MPYRVAVQTTLPVGGPDEIKDTTPPGAVLLGGTNGLSLTLAVSAGDAQAAPHYWDGTNWVNPNADVILGGKSQVSAFGTIPIANGQFYQRSGGPRWWAVLKTGAGTVAYCDVAEAEI